MLKKIHNWHTEFKEGKICLQVVIQIFFVLIFGGVRPFNVIRYFSLLITLFPNYNHNIWCRVILDNNILLYYLF